MSGAKVFVEVISSDDDDNEHQDGNSDDEEVVYVPYVKPSPPVIDLLLTSDDESSAVGEESSNKSESKKNRKRKKSKNYQTDDEKLCPDSIKSCTTAVPNSDQCLPNETPLPVTPSAVNAGQNERMLIHAVNTARQVNDEDGEHGTSVNAEPIVSIHNQGLSNVGASCSLSRNDDSNHQSHFLPSENEPFPGIRIASSIFESNSEVLGDPVSFAINGAASQVIEMSGTNAAELGGVTRSLEMGSSRGGQQVTPVVGGGPVRKAAAPKRKRNAPLATFDGDISMTTTPPPRKRVSKQQRAKQRTNEEINNFLTTLGIFEPNETIPDPNPKKRSRARDNLTITPLPLDVESLSLVPPPPSSELDLDLLVVPVPVTSSTPVPQLPRGGKRAKAKSTSGSNVLQQSDQPMPKQTETVPAVPSVLPPILTADMSSLGRTRFVSMNEDVEMLTRTERAALSFNISSVLDAPPKSTTRVTSKDPILNQTATVSTPSIESEAQKPSETRVTDINLPIPIPEQQPKSIEFLQPDPYAFVDNDGGGSENEVAPRPSYIPSKWTSGMVRYYDCTSNEDMRLSRVLSQMSDNPALWETSEQQLFSGYETNKRLRCVNCNQFGHLIWNCKEQRKKRVCHFCGEEGHGLTGRDRDRGSSRCPNAVCLNCGRSQPKANIHGCRRCMYVNRPPRCETCKSEGHFTSRCPDNWRKFFSTTTVIQDGTVQLCGDKPVYQLHKDSFCATCGQKGHNFFHCRYKGRTSSGDKYIKQNPRIVDELPQLRKRLPATSTVTSSYPAEDDVPVSLPLGGSNNNNGEQRIVNMTTKNIIVSTNDNEEVEVAPLGNVHKCMDPECQNTPTPNTFCFEMLIKQKEHKLMLSAQSENNLSESMRPNSQLSILQNRNAIHIYSDNIPQCQADVLKLISKLNTEASNKNSKPKVLEVITIDDDDNEAEKASAPLTVALLESELGLIFSESLNKNGLIAKLIEKFNVNVFVCKETMMATIDNGTEENKKLAMKNIVFWLECQAANVEYIMQEDFPSNVAVSPWTKKKKKKKKTPRPKKFKNRKRLDNNSAVISDLISNASLNHNTSQQLSTTSGSHNRKQKRYRDIHRQKFRDRNHRQRMPDEIPIVTNNNVVPSTSNNPNNARYFNNNDQQMPLQNGNEGRFPNPQYNNHAPPPPDFHPSFINHQQYPHQRPPPLLGDFIPFRHESPRHGRGGGGRGGFRRSRGNYQNRYSPNKRQQDGRNLLHY